MAERKSVTRPKWEDPDLDDIPDTSGPEWAAAIANGVLKEGDKVIRRGRRPSDDRKIATSIRLDPDIVEHFKAGGPGWQSRMNDALRRSMQRKAKTVSKA